MLHALKPADHRLDPRAHLLVLLQQVGALRDQGVLALPERAVFLLELAASDHQVIKPLAELLELVAEGFFRILCHETNIEAALSRVKCAGGGAVIA